MKKIMNKDNKGFSLIELIIVIAIMAILIAVIAPNLTKYLAKSKQSTDKKNADEIAAQIQNAITDYETENKALGAVSEFTWADSGVTTGADTKFDDILNAAITSNTKSKETGDFAKGKIELKDASDATKGYTITVTVGNQVVTR